ncbi:Tripartite motif-containing protein 14 [Camelus dromedarius]|uniref:Tripartite motif-containing protein 14 n=1 Tax=Camelus dromedarius TaxID=9838 RepID=A0A5N4E949_CAMDR|nr:Tripartite motif-containing protein 14 [Camelus dromedarius]
MMLLLSPGRGRPAVRPSLPELGRPRAPRPTAQVSIPCRPLAAARRPETGVKMAGTAALSRTPGGLGPEEPEDARGWRCPEHGDRAAELFCRRCRRCVCALCPLLGAHRGHPVDLAREEAARVQGSQEWSKPALGKLPVIPAAECKVGCKKKFTQECLTRLASKKQEQVGNITQIEDAAEKLKATSSAYTAHAESSKTWLTGKFTELRLLLDEEEALAKKFIDKNTQLALQVYRERIKSCGEQIDVMDNLSSRVWSISQEPNPIQLLQEYTAAEQQIQRQMSLGEVCQPVPFSFEPVKSFFNGLVEAMQSLLQTPLDVRLKESKSPYARTPTLEPDTMHARLRLSADRLMVRCCLFARLGPAPTVRFDSLWQVLGRDCFAAGRHYWEVDLQEAGIGWWVGAAYGSLRRHGATAASRLGCNRQSWCLKRYDLEYWAFHDGQRSRLRPRDDPDRLGVFLDYEAGVLAFYDVTGGMSHLYTFRAAFQEPLYPALRLWEGAISMIRLP